MYSVIAWLHRLGITVPGVHSFILLQGPGDRRHCTAAVMCSDNDCIYVWFVYIF